MRTGALGALLIVLLFVAACGGDDRLSKEEYEASVREITIRTGAAIQVGPETPPQIIPERLDIAVMTLREAVDELDNLNPPEEVQEPHDLLVMGISELGSAVEELRDDVKDIDDPIELRETVDRRRELLRGLTKVAEAQNQFNQLGYTF